VIGFLSGKVRSKSLDSTQITLMAYRVGYEVVVPATFFDRLSVGARAELWVHSHVREDTFALYGFATEAEKLFFRLLLGVSGLGPKSALALLSEHGAENLAHHIRVEDAVSLSSAPGIGKKLAQKIILDLQPKVEKLAWVAGIARPRDSERTAVASSAYPLRDDLASALLNLGFAPHQIKPAVERVFEREEAEKEGFEVCLKLALKEMGTRAVAGGESRG
jgi:holliday junction DNA helicase RuvA